MRRSTADLEDVRPSQCLPWPADDIVAALEPLVLPERRARLQAVASGRVCSVVVVLEALHDPHNVAAVLRTADAMGVGEVHLVAGDEAPTLSRRVTKGCERWLDLYVHPSPHPCVAALRARGYALYVADARADTALDVVAHAPRVAVVFGNEHRGVSPALRALADGAFAVPMRGMVESLNVSVAAAITLHAATQHRVGELGPDEARAQYARCLYDAVRDPEPVLARYRATRAAQR